MPKFDRLRTLAANSAIKWPTDTITCLAMTGYAFDATDDSLPTIQQAGGVILASNKLADKSVTSDGFAQSGAVSLKLLPAGGPYDILLFLTTDVLVPLVLYEDVVTLADAGDVLVRPSGSVLAGAGSWFRF